MVSPLIGCLSANVKNTADGRRIGDVSTCSEARKGVEVGPIPIWSLEPILLTGSYQLDIISSIPSGWVVGFSDILQTPIYSFDIQFGPTPLSNNGICTTSSFIPWTLGAPNWVLMGLLERKRDIVVKMIMLLMLWCRMRLSKRSHNVRNAVCCWCTLLGTGRGILCSCLFWCVKTKTLHKCCNQVLLSVYCSVCSYWTW